jgi:hypothetical protein
MSEQQNQRADDEHPASSTETESVEEPEEAIGDAIGRFMMEGPFIPHVFIAGGRMIRRIVGPVNPD